MKELTTRDMIWIRSRLPKRVADMMKEHKELVLAGGFIRSSIAGETVHDIDLFSPTVDFARARSLELATTKEDVHTTKNAYTVTSMKPTVQFVSRWTYDQPLALVESFDYTIACAAMWYDGCWRSMCCDDYYSDLAAKRLVYLSPKRNEDAGGSTLRMLKFYQRGYRTPVNSLGAVVARLLSGIKIEKLPGPENEEVYATVITGLLNEVDPLFDPDHIAHFPKDEDGTSDSND